VRPGSMGFTGARLEAGVQALQAQFRPRAVSFIGMNLDVFRHLPAAPMSDCVYSDMPSFLSQSAICCIAATKVRSWGLSKFFAHDYRKITPKRTAKACLRARCRSANGHGRNRHGAAPPESQGKAGPAKSGAPGRNSTW
jgi:hypothetical protein